MKRSISILAIVALAFTMLAGCATTSIDKCAVYQNTYNAATAELQLLKNAGVIEGDAVNYWVLAQSSAAIAMAALGCPVIPSPVVVPMPTDKAVINAVPVVPK